MKISMLKLLALVLLAPMMVFAQDERTNRYEVEGGVIATIRVMQPRTGKAPPLQRASNIGEFGNMAGTME